MINRIRDIRAQKGMTLAQVAAACTPPTTAQTIGRLETGMRNLSLVWMNKIAAALDVEPEVLLRSETAGDPQVTAVLTSDGADAPRKGGDALLPTALASEGALRVVAVEAPSGEYRSGDQIWLRELPLDQVNRGLNRDVLAPQPAGRFAFGRLLQHEGGTLTLLPPSGQKHVTVKDPAWIAVAEMLVRKL
ncbi:helix-turn-helix transcriptional regulator [Novosphingobium sp. 9U]|uniref:helix-turn-helix transcriptional regulator n=1 Tax=Novosphingobium sp. 9U TaxID=2653158 RepID=UPI0012EFA82C|nr:helix-turn-helix transcriptional regulator [Novosphingobium sp. 9U]VWX51349.1 XRE family transcriptional regulator [Novosphingobium sp. 9U]